MPRHESACDRHRGFTLLELLVSLGIIALLISLVLVAVTGVRASANRTQSINALRGMMRAYASYSTDHRSQLLPGFMTDGLLSQLRIAAELSDGTRLDQAPFCGGGNVCDASPYVWRLAPYIDFDWKTYFVDYQSGALISRLDEEFSNEEYGPGSIDPNDGDLGIGMVPAFGLNSIYLGGDSYHGSADVVARNPFAPADPNDVLAATNLAQVRSPARIVVFGAAMQLNGDLLPDNPLIDRVQFGYVELHPPFIGIDEDNQGVAAQWAIVDGRIEATGGDFGQGGGVPVGRWGQDKVPVGHLDGSAEVVNRYELATDMRYWSPYAVGIR